MHLLHFLKAIIYKFQTIYCVIMCLCHKQVQAINHRAIFSRQYFYFLDLYEIMTYFCFVFSLRY